MKTDILINGHIALVITPENEMEKEILKALCKQDNEMIELRSAVQVLGKTLRDGIVITGKGAKVSKEQAPDSETTPSEKKPDEK